MEKKNLIISEWLRHELELRNYSPRTISTYCELLKRAEKAIGLSFDKITTERYKKYIHHRIIEDGVSTSTVNQLIGVFKIVQVDLLKRDWDAIRIKRPRRNIKLPVVLSKQEMERMIQSTINLKHRAILMLTYSSGLRRQELQWIKPSAIDSEQMRVLIVKGKGRKDRYSLLSVKTLEILRQYYKLYRPEHLLFEPQGNPSKPLSETTLNKIVKRSAEKAGIKKQVSFHTLRHCFATHLLENGVNLRLIQQFLGHTSLRTTATYLHLANIDITTVRSPLDDMNV